MSDHLKQFVFKGVLARHAVSDLEAGGVLHGAESVAADRADMELFVSIQESIRTSSLQMQRAFRILYVLENTIRELIVRRLEEKEGFSWFDKLGSQQMKQRVSQRKEQENKNQWHTGRNAGDIYYLDFGDLAKLITTYWSSFEDLLPNQAWVQARLDEAERSRNVIAHTNLLASEESVVSNFIFEIGYAK